MKYAILLARQRSGTGALGSVLGNQPGLKYLGEVFHPANLGQTGNYFTYLMERLKSDPEAALPDNRYDVFHGFLEAMSEHDPDQTLIVDIKYRSLHHLNGGWHGLEERPRAISETIARKLPVIHLTRRNALQTFLSGRLAEANKVWHARKDQEISITSAALNIRKLSNYIVTSGHETRMVEGWLRKYPHLESFDYDEMFDADGLLDNRIADRLAKLLDVAKFANRAPAFVKQAPTGMEAAIENYPLVRQALTGTDAEWMLR